ncbi:MAG: phage terminase small subunit [Varibaculum sp.]
MRWNKAETPGTGNHGKYAPADQGAGNGCGTPKSATIADRVEYKRDAVAALGSTVEAYLERAGVCQPGFAWCVIWLFDVGDLDKALDWADIAISQRQAADRLRSNFPTFVANTMLAWAQETAGRRKC